VFGPNQNPNNPYAAVIPLFCKAFLSDESPKIFGDGEQSRDFTFVDNAVEANFLAMFNENKNAQNQIYNVACAESCTLNKMVDYLNEISGKSIAPKYVDKRKGDILHSLADISKIRDLLGYEPKIKMKEGLERVYNWYSVVNS